MAHITHSAPVAWPLNALAGLGRAFQSFFLALSVASTSDARLREMERLQALSDEELAKRGLTRDRIVNHVFRDLFYV